MKLVLFTHFAFMFTKEAMSYFANFQQQNSNVFRLDTRIYLHDQGGPSPQDVCIAAIVGKNPGSASPTAFGKLLPLALNNDRMLPTVRCRFRAAYGLASKQIPNGAFVRVWNLFYLCDPNLKSAIRRFCTLSSPMQCNTERTIPPIVWYAWGGGCLALDPLKARFSAISPLLPFYYDKHQSIVVSTVPSPPDFAKHPQGLLANPIVTFLSRYV